MGNTFEVWSWGEDDDGETRYIQVYAGELWDEAYAAMVAEKKKGAGCVKLEWRGTP